MALKQGIACTRVAAYVDLPDRATVAESTANLSRTTRERGYPDQDFKHVGSIILRRAAAAKIWGPHLGLRDDRAPDERGPPGGPAPGGGRGGGGGACRPTLRSPP